jgi:cytochrome c biogenesis protein ResB
LAALGKFCHLWPILGQIAQTKMFKGRPPIWLKICHNTQGNKCDYYDFFLGAILAAWVNFLQFFNVFESNWTNK